MIKKAEPGFALTVRGCLQAGRPSVEGGLPLTGAPQQARRRKKPHCRRRDRPKVAKSTPSRQSPAIQDFQEGCPFPQRSMSTVDDPPARLPVPVR